MHPKIQIVHREVGPDVAHLLLATAPHFLHIVKVLFDGSTIGKRFENLLDALLWIGREESVPTMILFHEYHANDAAYGRVGRQKGFVGLGDSFAVDRAAGRLPTPLLSSPFGQAETVLAILARLTAATALTLSELRRQVSQGGIFSQAADNRDAGLQSSPQERPLGITAIDDDPGRFSSFFQDRNDPFDQTGPPVGAWWQSDANDAPWESTASSAGEHRAWRAAAAPTRPTRGASRQATW